MILEGACDGVYAIQGMRVAILAMDDFEQSELTEPKKALEEAGAQALIVAPHPGRNPGHESR